MKPTILLYSAVLVMACPVLQTFAEDQTSHPDTGQTTNQLAFPEHLGTFSRLSRVLGANVYNTAGEKLGHIQELGAEMKSGRVVVAIVSDGGFLGIGDKMVAVPPSAFKTSAAQGLRLDTDKARLKAAAEFDVSKWDESTREDKLAAIYRDYQTTPYFGPSADPGLTPAPDAIVIGIVEPASKMVGTSVKGSKDREAGRVDTLLVDLQAGRLVEVVLATGGFLGMGDAFNPIPPQVFVRQIGKDSWILDLAKEEPGLAPRFNRTEWAKAMDPNYIVEVYRHYGVKPYFDPAAGIAADRHGPAGGARPDKGFTEADLDVTRNIEAAIAKAAGLSPAARGVRVAVRDGHIILRGSVVSDAERARIVEIASRYTDPSKVHDRMELEVTSANK